MKDGSKEASFMAQTYRRDLEKQREQKGERRRGKRLINVPRPHFN